MGKSNARARCVATLAALAMTSCSIAPPDITSYAPLSRLYAARFPVGAAIEPWQLDGREGALLAWHYSGVVAENAMKATRLQPEEGRFSFSDADGIVAFAERHGMRMRGHTLLWHEETPGWVWRAGDGSAAHPALVLERLRTHISTVVGRYRGRVHSWDVVNEVVDPSGPGCLRDTAWLRVIGPAYLDAAFHAAHAADPGARLLLNDYETADPARRECVLRLATSLRARGVPLHGIGHQMHVRLDGPSPEAVDATLAAVAALGLDNEITELDMTLGPASTRGLEALLLEKQARRYAELFRVFARRPDVKAVTFWGVSDAHTWLNMKRAKSDPDRPLLFDAAQRPKPAYHAVAAAAS
jgi:endo-1,4-beta-xylanase